MDEISAVIISKNSEEHLEEVLKAVKKVADEIVLVDSYSEDSTLDIAKRYDCRIFQHDFQGYGEERNWGAEKAQNKWILSIDTDEVLSQELIEELRSWKTRDKKYCVYEIDRVQYVFGERISHWRDSIGRIYDRTEVRFETPGVHESLNYNHSGRIKGELKHYTYDSVEEYLSKMNRYTTQDSRNIDNTSAFKAVLASIIALFRRLFIQRMILDGRQGLFVAIASASSMFYKHWKFLVREDV